jgi:transcriptional regulator with XRE-family HTH domain
MATNSEIGERIKIRRDYLRLTQGDLAELVAVSRETVSNWERGYRGIDARDLPALARALKVNINYFFEGEAADFGPDELPPDLRMIYEAQGKVYRDLPPGKARQQYLDSLRSNAEAMRAAVAARLDSEAS